METVHVKWKKLYPRKRNQGTDFGEKENKHKVLSSNSQCPRNQHSPPLFVAWSRGVVFVPSVNGTANAIFAPLTQDKRTMSSAAGQSTLTRDHNDTLTPPVSVPSLVPALTFKSKRIIENRFAM